MTLRRSDRHNARSARASPATQRGDTPAVLPLVAAISLAAGILAALHPAGPRLRAAESLQTALDGDGDGVVTRAEVDRAARGSVAFADLDRSGDGTLDVAELHAWLVAMDPRAPGGGAP